MSPLGWGLHPLSLTAESELPWGTALRRALGSRGAAHQQRGQQPPDPRPRACPEELGPPLGLLSFYVQAGSVWESPEGCRGNVGTCDSRERGVLIRPARQWHLFRDWREEPLRVYLPQIRTPDEITRGFRPPQEGGGHLSFTGGTHSQQKPARRGALATPHPPTGRPSPRAQLGSSSRAALCSGGPQAREQAESRGSRPPSTM